MCSSSDLFLTLSWAEDSILQYCIRLLLYSCVPPKVLMSLVWLEGSLCVRTEEPPGKVLETLSYVKKWAWIILKEPNPWISGLTAKDLLNPNLTYKRLKVTNWDHQERSLDHDLIFKMVPLIWKWNLKMFKLDWLLWLDKVIFF